MIHIKQLLLYMIQDPEYLQSWIFKCSILVISVERVHKHCKFAFGLPKQKIVLKKCTSSVLSSLIRVLFSFIRVLYSFDDVFYNIIRLMCY